MKIHNVRLGLATNSSSSHSIVIIPKGMRLRDKYDDGDGFGWDDFTLLSQKNKDKYLASALYHAVAGSLGHDVAVAVVQQWVGVAANPNPTYRDETYPSIDHQSVMTFPLDWDEKAVDKGFFDAFRTFVSRDDVAILGGNDNSDGHPTLSKPGVINTDHMGLPTESSSRGFICKKEEGYWVLFDRNNGTKVRVSFDQPEGFVPTKASAPELVDIKITDYCPFGCPYCYQDSTPKGSHAPFNIVKGLAQALAEMQTFEVALGGGEPTMHPEFVNILKTFRENRIVPNFTTKSTYWIKNDELRKAILEQAGSFAYSVENGAEAKEIIALCEQHDIGTSRWDSGAKLVLHYVMGAGTEQDFKGVLRVAKEHWVEVTLLGYKTNGRGHAFAPKSNGNWVKYVSDLHKANDCPQLGIDTKLAQISLNELKAAGIPDEMYHTEEGKFSMYIDAVNGLIAPSSYCEPEEMKMLEFRSYEQAKTLTKHFQTF